MKKLSIQEEAIMQKVWKLKKCTVTEILKELPEPKPPYTTIASVMRNLKQKGTSLKKSRALHTVIYQP